MTDTQPQSDLGDPYEAGGIHMDEDRNWLKNPILPRPPAVPRFSAAELRLVEGGERPSQSQLMSVAARNERSAPLESRVSARESRESGESSGTELESEASQSRRIA